MSQPGQYRLFVACAPGIEPLLVRELQGLGFVSESLPGGAELTVDLRGVYRVLLGCGLGLRVLLRFSPFKATRFKQLKRGIAELPLAQLLPKGCDVAVKATAKKSRLYHSGAIAQRVQEVFTEALGSQTIVLDSDSPEPSDASVVVVYVRMDHDKCTVSLDLCGTPMQRRGYRLQSTKAPFREDLARALLLMAGYDGSEALVDPLCGSGTFLIEGCSIATGAAPGGKRSFAIQDWPMHQEALMSDARATFTKGLDKGPVIIGSDRDRGAVAASQGNAARAGCDAHIKLAQGALSAAVPPATSTGGLIIANPPYGKRIGKASKLRDLYASLGDFRRRAPEGYRLAIVTSNPGLAAATGVDMPSVLMTDLGGLKVKFYVERKRGR